MNTALFIALVSPAILLPACGVAPTVSPSPVPVSPTPTISPAPIIPRWLTTLQARWTLAPTETPTTPTPSPQPTPTLSRKDQDTYALQLVATNGGCELPCLLGIVPSHTTRAQLDQIFRPLSEYQLAPLNLTYPFYGRRAFLTIDANARQRAGQLTGEPVISRMAVGLDTKAVSPSGSGMLPQPDLAQAADSFYLSSILTRFGPPDRIFLRAFPPDQIVGWPPFFDLILFYDELGFSVAYHDPPTPITPAGTIRHCFSQEDVERIEVTAHSIEDGHSLEQVIDNMHGLIRGFEELVQDRVYIAVEEATGYTIGEFSEMYRIPQSTCLYSPADLWGWPMSLP